MFGRDRRRAAWNGESFGAAAAIALRNNNRSGRRVSGDQPTDGPAAVVDVYEGNPRVALPPARRQGNGSARAFEPPELSDLACYFLFLFFTLLCLLLLMMLSSQLSLGALGNQRGDLDDACVVICLFFVFLKQAFCVRMLRR